MSTISPDEIYALIKPQKQILCHFSLLDDFNFVKTPSPSHIRVHSCIGKSLTHQEKRCGTSYKYQKIEQMAKLNNPCKSLLIQSLGKSSTFSQKANSANIKLQAKQHTLFFHMLEKLKERLQVNILQPHIIPKITCSSATSKNNCTMSVNTIMKCQLPCHKKASVKLNKSLNITSYNLHRQQNSTISKIRKIRPITQVNIKKPIRPITTDLKEFKIQGKETKISSHESTPKSKTTQRPKFKRNSLRKASINSDLYQGWASDIKDIGFADGCLAVQY
jgi:hypothetical protein